jgi:hypothetical protein
MKYIFRLYCRTLVNGRYLSSGKTVWLRGWRTGLRRGLKVQAQTVQGSSDLSAVGLVTCTPFSTRGSAHLPSTLLRRSHHPCLSFAVLMQFVSETLAPSSLFDIFARSLLWQSRVNHTCLIQGLHHNPDSLSPYPTAAAGLAIGGLRVLLFHRHLRLCVAHASSLALITLRLPGDQLATAGALSLEHPPCHLWFKPTLQL